MSHMELCRIFGCGGDAWLVWLEKQEVGRHDDAYDAASAAAAAAVADSEDQMASYAEISTADDAGNITRIVIRITDVHGNEIPRGNGNPMGFPGNRNEKQISMGMVIGMGNDFRGIGNVGKCFVKKNSH